MGLFEYRRKRDFSKTPEPKGEVVEERRKSAPLRFASCRRTLRDACTTIFGWR